MTLKQRRQSIQLTEPQRAFLNAEAQLLGITTAELVRRILDEYRLKTNNPTVIAQQGNPS